MVSLVNLPINAVTMAARPAAPFAAAVAAGYFLFEANNLFFTFAREALDEQNKPLNKESSKDSLSNKSVWTIVTTMSFGEIVTEIACKVGNFFMKNVVKGSLYVGQVAFPTMAFFALPLDPIGLTIRIGMATRFIFWLSGNSLGSLMLNKTKQLLPKEIVALVERLYKKYFGQEQIKEIKLERGTIDRAYLDDPIKEKSIVEAVTTENFERIGKSNAANPLVANKKDGEIISNKNVYVYAPKNSLGEFDYLQEYATDSWSTAMVAFEQKAKTNPFAAFQKVAQELAKKNAPSKATVYTGSNSSNDVDVDFKTKTRETQKGFDTWFSAIQRPKKIMKEPKFPKERKTFEIGKTKSTPVNNRMEFKQKPQPVVSIKPTTLTKLATTGIKLLRRKG